MTERLLEENERMLETERRSTTSRSLKNSLWERLQASHDRLQNGGDDEDDDDDESTTWASTASSDRTCFTTALCSSSKESLTLKEPKKLLYQ